MSDENSTHKDDEFFSMADSYIALANKQSKDAIQGKVSATFLYAAARFNTFLVAANASSKKEFEKGRESSIEYFVLEYKKMLEEHFTDYVSNFDTYIRANDKPVN
ncbi:hypothetical protein MNBD_GAMMA22-2567 [hydrothermal vent metagenome]|uniref:DUF3144 domain-containing protein n=1 Tax=hydrothermal vent metagenome TaxID=652676 RepID=A0A3B1B7Z3_9ZZZZ